MNVEWDKEIVIMGKIINSLHNYLQKYGFKNLFGGDDFFNKEATINEYLKLYPNRNRKYVTYDELYEEAVAHIGKISFKEKTNDFENYFYLLTNQDKIIGITIGILGYIVAREVDAHGKDIEKNIEKAVDKITGVAGYDTNNPFDTKYGKGHRVFGHDPAMFAFQKIPSDYIIYVKNESAPMTRKTILVRDFLKLPDDKKTVTMLDIIWKFYGNDSNLFKGIWSCIGHIIVHFTKDLFTPEGLPIPFTSMFEKFTSIDRKNISASILEYNKSLYKKTKNAHIKASDFISLATIEVLTKLYCEKEHLENHKNSEYKDDIKIIAMGTCIGLQCSGLMFSEKRAIGKKGQSKIIDGQKINLPLLTAYMNIVRKELFSIIKANRKLSKEYKRMNNE